jgi:hypothetical protein
MTSLYIYEHLTNSILYVYLCVCVCVCVCVKELNIILKEMK